MSNDMKSVHIDRHTRGEGKHQPGHAYTRDFNHRPTGRFGVKMARGKGSRSKTARS